MIYLDHAATTPLADEAFEAMRPHLTAVGNASSAHAAGRDARAAVEEARDRVATAIGAAPLEVLFTSGGTESDNTAVIGMALAGREQGRAAHVVTTSFEHHAVLDSARALQRFGFTVDEVPPEPDGVVDPERLLAAVRDDTAVVSVMAVNNEIGTTQPLDVIGPALRDRGVPLHTDAVQAFGKVALEWDAWGLTAMSLSGHKFNGPKGVGVLALRRDAQIVPLLYGGGQERGVRSGTFNTPGIAGLAAAAALTARTMAEEVPRLRRLRDRLADGLLSVDGVTVNGSMTKRVPHNLHVGVEGCDGEALLVALDMAGVCASAGSACQSGATELSYVLAAIGAPAGSGHLRFTCGRSTTEHDVDDAATIFGECVKRLRDAGGGYIR